MFNLFPFGLTIPWWATLPTVPLLLYGLQRTPDSSRWRRTVLVVSTALIALCGCQYLKTGYSRWLNPPQFDFQIFWLYGRATADGLSPYEAENLRQLAEPLAPSDVLLAELFCFQTPPALLMYAPLGWLDLRTACALWLLVHGLLLLAASYWLWRTFAVEHGVAGCAATAALTAGMLPAIKTFAVAQINFLVLLMFVLYWRNRHRIRGGAWLAAAILAKPVAFLFPFYFLLKRNYRALAGMVGASAVLSAVTILAFGWDMFASYFIANPIAQDMPDELLIERINQSLLAVISRANGFDLSSGSPYLQPAFIAAAALFTAATGWLVWRLPKQYDDWSNALMLTLCLLLFPKTLEHYSVLLMVPIFQLWSRREQLVGGLPMAILTATLVYASLAMRVAFAANLICWLALTAGGLQLARAASLACGTSKSCELFRRLSILPAIRRLDFEQRPQSFEPLGFVRIVDEVFKPRTNAGNPRLLERVADTVSAASCRIVTRTRLLWRWRHVR